MSAVIQIQFFDLPSLSSQMKVLSKADILKFIDKSGCCYDFDVLNQLFYLPLQKVQGML